MAEHLAVCLVVRWVDWLAQSWVGSLVAWLVVLMVVTMAHWKVDSLVAESVAGLVAMWAHGLVAP